MMAGKRESRVILPGMVDFTLAMLLKTDESHIILRKELVDHQQEFRVISVTDSRKMLDPFSRLVYFPVE